MHEDGNMRTYLGTKGYMAPEVAKLQDGQVYDGFKSDIFSMGVILFIFSRGKPPFTKYDLKSDDSLLRLIKL
jgi:serine/threonine protein kinase